VNSEGFDLERFVSAQDPVYPRVLKELGAGAKTSHWMWFVFPQLKQLGRSSTAQHFGISSRAEAIAYWRHPVLGPRLVECTELLLAVQGRSAHQILGSPDDLKLRSSLTLFALVAPDEPVFQAGLEKLFDGRNDPNTVDLL
jgi:uncharacterized protein (DUF1810 family)